MPEGIDNSEALDRSLRARGIARAPIVAFIGVEIYAFLLWLNVSKAAWFHLDDWDFVAQRTAGDPGDLFRPHNGHWVTLPVLLYRALYQCFGLRTYLPYRVAAVVLYLVAAALLLVVMRRAGVDPWIATGAASLFALFGTGWQNILRPFQVTFTSALVFGLVALILTDRDGRLRRRDLFGVIAGLLALMSSGVGLVMVIVVGASALLRRGWRVAGALVAPLLGVYVVWLLSVGHENSGARFAGPSTIARFVLVGLGALLRHFGPRAWFGLPLALILFAGLFVAARRSRSRLGQLAVPIALLLGAIVFLAAAATQGRTATGSVYAKQSRYVSLVAALSLPALAVAVDALTRRWRWLVPIGMAVFLVGIPSNIAIARRAQLPLGPIYAGTRRAVEIVPRVDGVRDVPGSLQPDPMTAPGLTVGWLLGALVRHDVPRPDNVTARDLATADFRLSFYQDDKTKPNVGCRTVARATSVNLLRGDEMEISGPSLLVIPQGPLERGAALMLAARFGSEVHILRDVGAVKMVAYNKGTIPRFCFAQRPHPSA